MVRMVPSGTLIVMRGAPDGAKVVGGDRSA